MAGSRLKHWSSINKALLFWALAALHIFYHLSALKQFPEYVTRQPCNQHPTLITKLGCRVVILLSKPHKDYTLHLLTHMGTRFLPLPSCEVKVKVAQ